jgi:hypothetical protein
MRKSAILALALGAGLGGAAHASTLQAIYTDPRRVEILPSEASPNRLIITGAFFKHQMNGKYNDPVCGYMYFECQPGDEAMCRMQWTELRDNFVGDAQLCAGFGQLNGVSMAKIHPVGTPLGTPDKWDLGMGIAAGVSVDNKCPAAKKLVCQLDAPDMSGPGDMAAAPPADLSKPPVTPPGGGGGCSLGGGAAAAGLPGAAGLLLALGVLLRRRRR